MLKLGVFGDSFAQCSVTYSGWPDDLSKMINLPIDNFGRAGTSLWYSYKKFLENFKNYSHIVFTYTNPHRWASLPDHLVKWAWLTNQESIDMALSLSESTKKQMTTLLEAHKILFDPDLDIFLYQHIFNQVNKICKENNIKIYNVLPFEIINIQEKRHRFLSWYTNHNSEKLNNEYFIDFSLRKGPCLVNLSLITSEEMKQKDEFPKLDFIHKVADIRGCHMNVTNNKVIATILTENWDSTDNKVINTYKDSRLNFEPKELIEMIDAYENRK